MSENLFNHSMTTPSYSGGLHHIISQNPASIRPGVAGILPSPNLAGTISDRNRDNTTLSHQKGSNAPETRLGCTKNTLSAKGGNSYGPQNPNNSPVSHFEDHHSPIFVADKPKGDAKQSDRSHTAFSHHKWNPEIPNGRSDEYHHNKWLVWLKWQESIANRTDSSSPLLDKNSKEVVVSSSPLLEQTNEESLNMISAFNNDLKKRVWVTVLLLLVSLMYALQTVYFGALLILVSCRQLYGLEWLIVANGLLNIPFSFCCAVSRKIRFHTHTIRAIMVFTVISVLVHVAFEVCSSIDSYKSCLTYPKELLPDTFLLISFIFGCYVEPIVYLFIGIGMKLERDVSY